MGIIVFDLETNGLNPSLFSVLSFAAIKYNLANNYNLVELDRLQRFYYPRENFSQDAIRVNNLTRENIDRLRRNKNYPLYFDEDLDIKSFFNGTELIVGHNVDFDLGFIKQIFNGNKFCTMKENTRKVKARWIDSKNDWKWPTLEETANYYRISIERNRLHDSLYDVELTAKIFMIMLRNDEEIRRRFVVRTNIYQ